MQSSLKKKIRDLLWIRSTSIVRPSTQMTSMNHLQHCSFLVKIKNWHHKMSFWSANCKLIYICNNFLLLKMGGMQDNVSGLPFILKSDRDQQIAKILL